MNNWNINEKQSELKLKRELIRTKYANKKNMAQMELNQKCQEWNLQMIEELKAVNLELDKYMAEYHKWKESNENNLD